MNEEFWSLDDLLENEEDFNKLKNGFYINLKAFKKEFLNDTYIADKNGDFDENIILNKDYDNTIIKYINAICKKANMFVHDFDKPEEYNINKITDKYFVIAFVDSNYEGASIIIDAYEQNNLEDLDDFLDITDDFGNNFVGILNIRLKKEEETKKNKGNIIKGGNTMSKILNTNKEAVKNASILEASNIVLRQVKNQIKPLVPMIFKGYMDTATADIVVANLVNFVVDNYYSGNPKVNVISEKMMEVAMLNFLQSFNLAEKIDEIMEGKNVKNLLSKIGENTKKSTKSKK